MTPAQFPKAWRPLRAAVRRLHVPWLDELSRQARNPYQILVSCILSLRTKDETTGRSSERLFRLASTPKAMAALSERAIQKAIYPAGFYRVKARTILELSRTLIKDHKGLVPDTMEGLLSLKGVGRKTANLVLTTGFGKQGICVDTHVHRITNRWSLVATTTPHQTELSLRGLLPRRYWPRVNPTLVPFGQHLCTPLSPFCTTCPIPGFCSRVGVTRHR
jgi:endonuclease-3